MRLKFFAAALAITLPGLQEPAPKESDKEIKGLIDKLVEVADEDIGYGASWTGSKFSAIEESGKPGMRILDGKAPKGSPLVRDLVKKGASAIPLLITHLDDARKSKITVRHAGGFGGMFFEDEYDYNRRTARTAPAGVNRDEFGRERKYRKHPIEHTLTVGDLCFVALGQIVNRQFNAIRYQPTAIIMVNSPTDSKALLAAIKKEWSDLTPEKHRESLIADARSADSRNRRSGAIQRLSYFYPEMAEKVALELLVKPTYCVFRVYHFVSEKLYTTKDPKEWKRLLDERVKKDGESFEEGVLEKLMEDRGAEDDEREGWKGVPEKVLAALFPGIDASKPYYPDALERYDLAEIIESMGRLQSRPLDEAVIGHFKQLGQGRYDPNSDDYFALACMRFLIGRGHDPMLKEYCVKRIPVSVSKHFAKELREMLDRLGEGK